MMSVTVIIYTVDLLPTLQWISIVCLQPFSGRREQRMIRNIEMSVVGSEGEDDTEASVLLECDSVGGLQTSIHTISVILPGRGISDPFVFSLSGSNRKGCLNEVHQDSHRFRRNYARYIRSWSNTHLQKLIPFVEKRGDHREYQSFVLHGHERRIPKMKSHISSDDFIGNVAKDEKQDDVATDDMQVMIVDDDAQFPCVIIRETDDCVYYVSEIAGGYCRQLGVRD